MGEDVTLMHRKLLQLIPLTGMLMSGQKVDTATLDQDNCIALTPTYYYPQGGFSLQANIQPRLSIAVIWKVRSAAVNVRLSKS